MMETCVFNLTFNNKMDFLHNRKMKSINGGKKSCVPSGTWLFENAWRSSSHLFREIYGIGVHNVCDLCKYFMHEGHITQSPPTFCTFSRYKIAFFCDTYTLFISVPWVHWGFQATGPYLNSFLSLVSWELRRLCIFYVFFGQRARMRRTHLGL